MTTLPQLRTCNLQRSYPPFQAYDNTETFDSTLSSHSMHYLSIPSDDQTVQAGFLERPKSISRSQGTNHLQHQRVDRSLNGTKLKREDAVDTRVDVTIFQIDVATRIRDTLRNSQTVHAVTMLPLRLEHCHGLRQILHMISKRS